MEMIYIVCFWYLRLGGSIFFFLSVLHFDKNLSRALDARRVNDSRQTSHGSVETHTSHMLRGSYATPHTSASCNAIEQHSPAGRLVSDPPFSPRAILSHQHNLTTDLRRTSHQVRGMKRGEEGSYGLSTLSFMGRATFLWLGATP